MQRELRRQWVCWIDCARWEFSESPFTLEKKNIETTSIDAEIDALQLHWWVWCCSMIWSKDSRMEACACYPFILSQSTFWSLALALHLIILDYSWSSLASFTSYSTFSGAALEVWRSYCTFPFGSIVGKPFLIVTSTVLREGENVISLSTIYPELPLLHIPLMWWHQCRYRSNYMLY